MLNEFERITAVAFPDAGQGAIIRFRTADLLTLRKHAGEAGAWATELQKQIMAIEPVLMLACLQVGLKKEDARTPLPGIDWNDLPFALETAAGPLIEALFRAIYGQRYVEIATAAAQLPIEAA